MAEEHIAHRVEIDPVKCQDGLVGIEQRGMDGAKILHHERSALVRIPAKIVLPVERMRQAIACVACLHEKRIERSRDCV